ncbi:MAG: S-adenosyl-l-methionine hydroxide adenosyltransferase family protein [Pseudomonadales bacterium]
MPIQWILIAISLGSLFAWYPSFACAQSPNGLLVLQTDFGERDGAVAAMRGVAYGVDASLRVEDLTHEIPAFDVWQASYRLMQTAAYWPVGTVFVSVVDPGVGTSRKSVVAFAAGRYFVTPDNGTLSLIALELGIDAVHEIDERENRLPGSYYSNTFHGRDVYVYTAARLASGKIDLASVGPELDVTSVQVIEPPDVVFADKMVSGFIPVLDPQYGNVWTNIPRATFLRLGARYRDYVNVTIRNRAEIAFQGVLPFVTTFGDVSEHSPLLYVNSLDNIALALNQGNFAAAHGIASGSGWTIELSLAESSAAE